MANGCAAAPDHAPLHTVSLHKFKKTLLPKVRLFLDRSFAILSSLQIVDIFNNTSADFVLISGDLLLKMTTILKELRIAQQRSKNKWTFVKVL
jgi:hypothetical protein